MRTGFQKCASWKSPEIPSKMRTLSQDAHRKLRIFEREIRETEENRAVNDLNGPNSGLRTRADSR
jgi:hypothetical protein